LTHSDVGTEPDFAVVVLHVKDHGVPTERFPLLKQIETVSTPRCIAGEINTSHLEVFGDRHGLVQDRLNGNPGDRYGLAGLKRVSAQTVRLADGILQIAPLHEGAFGQIMARKRSHALPTLDCMRNGLGVDGTRQRLRSCVGLGGLVPGSSGCRAGTR